MVILRLDDRIRKKEMLVRNHLFAPLAPIHLALQISYDVIPRVHSDIHE